MKTVLVLAGVCVLGMLLSPFVYCSPMLKSDRAGFEFKVQK